MKNYKKIGMVVAMDKEIAPFLEKIGKEEKLLTVNGFTVRKFTVSGKEVYLVKSGIGEIYAAGATQLLLTEYKVDAVFNFGVCGSLVDEIGIADTVFVNGVVHYDFDLSPIDPVAVGQYPGYDTPVINIENDLLTTAKNLFPNIPCVICASADKFVADKTVKENLNKIFGAKVCEMECAGVLLTALNSSVPVLIIKAVSDGNGGAEEFNRRVHTSAKVYIETLSKILERI